MLHHFPRCAEASGNLTTRFLQDLALPPVLARLLWTYRNQAAVTLRRHPRNASCKYERHRLGNQETHDSLWLTLQHVSYRRRLLFGWMESWWDLASTLVTQQIWKIDHLHRNSIVSFFMHFVITFPPSTSSNFPLVAEPSVSRWSWVGVATTVDH